MSETPNTPNTTNEHSALSSRFGTETDPLAKYDEGFREAEREDGIDPFEMFFEDVLYGDVKQPTINAYQQAFEQYRAYMLEVEDRHPACPAQEHITGFATWLATERDNETTTIEGKLRKIQRAYSYWMEEGSFPHENEESDPVSAARKKINFEKAEDKDPPHIDLEEHRERIQNIKHVRELACIVMEMKAGLRVGELVNIKLKDLHIDDNDLRDVYPDIGTNPKLQGFENALFIPSKFDRDGNKSKKSRILPLDEEMRYVLKQYLLIRPSNPEGWVFLSDAGHKKMYRNAVNEAWKKHYWPDYEFGEDDLYRSVTSHYGRHFFSSYWRIEDRMSVEDVQYMRGDVLGDDDHGDDWGPSVGSAAINEYLHNYYPRIEQRFRANKFDFRL
jgi:integrase/recombinase XerD